MSHYQQIDHGLLGKAGLAMIGLAQQVEQLHYCCKMLTPAPVVYT